MSDTTQLKKKIFLKGEVQVLTGLLIGSSSSAMDIGGIDKLVIRHPITRIPYIPGSSLKGKLRSLLELNLGQISSDDRGNSGPTHHPDHLPAQLFGYIKHRQNDNKQQRPSRVIVRDGELSEKSRVWLQDTELGYTEVKAENSIDRVTAAANPRFFERVPKGAAFHLEIILNVFETDLEQEMLNGIYQAIRLLNEDYLGGGGSRGNGQVNIQITSMDE
ncbi:MAG: type III-A CRISPR-associated RAMP protein Csm3, partial [Bacteroidota bacterium]